MEEEEDHRKDYKRFQVVYNNRTLHNECKTLTSNEIDELKRKDKGLDDFCRLCIFLTIFNFQELSWENRKYFWALLLNIDVSNDRNNEEVKKNYYDYAKMSV